jgi:branched-subunit amino acid aminotransferase/4-amino-4-deoxychorismate lyase
MNPSPPSEDGREPLAYLDGQFLPQRDLHLPLHDAGFVMGATVTDLCRTVRHRLYRWTDHFDRLRRSSRAARINLPLPEAEIERRAHELVEHNARLLASGQDLALVLLATPGPIGFYAGLPGGVGDAPPTFAMHTFPLPFARYRRFFTEGVRLVTPATRHVPAACIDPRIKQRSRLHWWLAEQEAHQTDPSASALLLDLDGHVTETAAANFLLVRDGTVFTPPRHTVLEGVSLRVVEELCSALGIRFEERPLTPHDCLSADEAMVCSTPYCLAGVSRINGAPLPWPGAVFQRLLAEWGLHMGLDIRGQILGDGAPEPLQ